MNDSTATTGIVLVTHGSIGRALIDVAEFILGQSLAEIGFVSFRQSAVEETGEGEILEALERANRGQGVLIMTDVGGASPHNQVAALLPSPGLALLTGLNLAMLIRAWNYRHRPPAELREIAAKGAVREIAAGKSRSGLVKEP